jgi:hypothetical protein
MQQEERAATKRTGRATCDLSISVDDYPAGLNHTEQGPFGDDGGDGWGDKLRDWMAETPGEDRAELDRMTALGHHGRPNRTTARSSSTTETGRRVNESETDTPPPSPHA